jgi:hypothetical protein
VVFAVVCPETWKAGERAQLGGYVISNRVPSDGDTNLAIREEGDRRDLVGCRFQVGWGEFITPLVQQGVP